MKQGKYIALLLTVLCNFLATDPYLCIYELKSRCNVLSNPILKQQAKYYFTLSFENFVETDYATEKYFGTLMTDTIQIVLDSPKIHDLSPVNDKIVINANEYSPSELAKYLKKLVKNKKKMAQLRHWRSKGISKKFLRYTHGNVSFELPK
eukprot:gene2969-4979_t